MRNTSPTPARRASSKSKKPSRPATAAARRERLEAILRALDARYPDATCALAHRDAWQLLVATILSAQCTDERVNKVTPALFAKYPTPRDFAAANQEELARDIYSTGFYNNKAKSLIGAAKTILEKFGGRIPRDIDQFLTIPGVARKTANVVLGTALGIPSGVVVDTHVARIAQRLDLTRETAPEKIEQDLMKQVPQDRWILFSHQVILFGREICQARKPKCAECPLLSLCYAPDKAVL
jgi:endonuclease-3